VERVLADIDAEHGRTIPLTDSGRLPGKYARRPLWTPSVRLK
jgi:hypothetical protein